jgi:hypothetical protein
MVWYFAERQPVEVLEPTSGGFVDRRHAFGVSVCEEDWLCLPPEREAELRKIRSVLDGFAQPRLVLPKSNAAVFRDDFIAMIALFASKKQFLVPNDQLCQFFRSYCDQLFGRVREHRQLGGAEWHGIVDRVFLRFFSGKVGKGFSMPTYPASFRAYVSKAIRGGAAGTAVSKSRPLRAGRFPARIDEAAASLGVSHMTVRRWMKRLQLRELNEDAWVSVSARISTKKRWQDLASELEQSGVEKEAARKRVQRLKKNGITPTRARGRCSSISPFQGTCAACGEERIAVSVHEGKPLCRTCYSEKTGVPATEWLSALLNE